MHTLSNFFSPVDCQEVSLCQARLLCYFDILNWSLYFWISLYHVASHNWEKSGVLLGFVESISRETDDQTPCQRALAAWWLRLGTVAPRPSLRLYMLMLVPIGTCPHILLQGICLTLELLNNLRFRISKNWLSRKIVFAFMSSYFSFSLKSNSKLGIWCTSPASTNQVNCANWPAYAKNLPFKLELIRCKLDKMNKQLNSTSLEF